MKNSWKIADIHKIKPRNENWPASIHSVGYFMGVTAYGINGKSVNKGESLTPEHNEIESGQQEVFVVLSGLAEFSLDGVKQTLKPGFLVVVESVVKRSAKALEDGTTMLILGGEDGKAFQPGWLQ